jgi:SWI/SNF-related matrix-associated actin-dependent regulator of chromatin subfamily A member 5
MEMYRVPLQQMKINYTVSTTNKKVYTEEEDRFLVVQLDKHGVDGDNLYDTIRDEIRDSPLFRFDWFFLSRTPLELSRRCTTLIQTIVKEFGEDKGTTNGRKGRDREEEEDEEEDTENLPPPKKKAKNGASVSQDNVDIGQHTNVDQNKQVAVVKGAKGSKATSTTGSRASSVGAAPVTNGKSKGKKK